MRAGCRRVPGEQGDAEVAEACGRSGRAACPAFVARRGCAAMARPAEPARGSREPGRRGGNASVIKGTRERLAVSSWLQHETRQRNPTLALQNQPRPRQPPAGLASLRHCPPGCPGTAMALSACSALCAQGPTCQPPPPSTRATSRASRVARDAGYAPVAPKSTSQGLQDAVGLLGPCAGH